LTRFPFWRYLPIEHTSGPWNMAVDEALLEMVASGRSMPVLRFYTWSAPWLSIGCAQRLLDDVLVDRVAEQGIGLLRRASGGTAVLHDEQIGFALVLPDAHPLAPADIVESYARLGAPVADALAGLGLPARAVSVGEARAAIVDPAGRLACFGSLSPFETVLDESRGAVRKLTGHGQIRRRGVVMHHVVIQCRFDALSLASLLRTPDQAALAAYLSTHIGSTAEHGFSSQDTPRIVAAIAAAMATAGHAELVDSELTPEESARARDLVTTKYGHASWLRRL
jgi:lipoyl(octanoyl) transferase